MIARTCCYLTVTWWMFGHSESQTMRGRGWGEGWEEGWGEGRGEVRLEEKYSSSSIWLVPLTNIYNNTIIQSTVITVETWPSYHVSVESDNQNLNSISSLSGTFQCAFKPRQWLVGTGQCLHLEGVIVVIITSLTSLSPHILLSGRSIFFDSEMLDLGSLKWLSSLAGEISHL